MRWVALLVLALVLSGCASQPRHPGPPPRAAFPEGRPALTRGDPVPTVLHIADGNWTRDDGRIRWPLPPAGSGGLVWNGTAPTVVGPATPTWDGSVFILGQSTG